jgi:beta-lactamase class A
VAQRQPSRSFLSIIAPHASANSDRSRQIRRRLLTGKKENEGSHPTDKNITSKTIPSQRSPQANSFASLFNNNEQNEPSRRREKYAAKRENQPNQVRAKDRELDKLSQIAQTKNLPTRRVSTGKLVDNQLVNNKLVSNQPGKNKRKRKPVSPVVYATRMLIVGVGLAVISGTALSFLNALGNVSKKTPNNTAIASQPEKKTPNLISLNAQQKIENTALKQQLETIAAKYEKLKLHSYFIDLDQGSFVNINGEGAIAAASTIKVPILVAFFQAVDQGKIRLDEKLTIAEEDMAKGSGDLQHQSPGYQLTALDTAIKMIVISDNTATNMLIKRLGGMTVLNQLFASWGLKNTVLNNILPDVEGTNTSSAKDLVNILSQVQQGGLVSMKSRDRIFYIMRATENNTLLPRGLGEGAIIAHKTGYIKSILGDVGMIDLPNGKRYLLGVIVERPPEQKKAVQLIREVSQTIYQFLENPSTNNIDNVDDSVDLIETDGET